MKKIYILISAVAALALTTACNLKTEFPPVAGENLISLDLQFTEPGVKSDGVGKENDINSVDYFFYTDITKVPVYSKRDSNPSEHITGNKYTISVTAGQDGVPALSDLFKDGKFEIYAVFNAPSEIAAAKLETVKQTAVDQSFAYYTEDDKGNKTWYVTPDEDPLHHEKYFVMTGQKTVRKGSGGSSANIDTEAEKTVDMRRVAAKVSVNVKILKSKTLDDGTTWVPFLGGNNVHLYMCNFVQNSLLSAADVNSPILPANYTQADYTNYVLNTSGTPATAGDYYVFESQQDFYTYPIEWTPGADEEPYFKLVLPWKEVDGIVPNKELYYKIMFPSSITSLDANKFYELDVTVSLLGNEGDPVILIKGDYAQVANWKNNSSVNSSVSNAKYLSVERESAEFYTQNSGISFVSSDNAYLVINNVYHKDLKSGSNEYIVQNGTIQNNDLTEHLGTPTWITDNGNIIGLKVGEGEDSEWIRLSNASSYLTVGHKLDADLTSESMDVTAWNYDVTLKLVGVSGTDYDRHVVFEQIPNVYIIADKNSNGDNPSGAAVYRGVFVNKVQNSAATFDGVTVVNNTNPTRYRERTGMYSLGSASGMTSTATAGTNNANMYVITIGVSSSYTIGDPRTANSNNYDDFVKGSGTRSYYRQGGYYYYLSTESNWAEAPALDEDNDRRLSYYHPASTEDYTKTMIAPQIRIASSYGKTQPTTTKEFAEMHCAGYQEDGIPAGRWRLPTLAEIKFISSLSALNRIPYLFGDNENASTFHQASYYWSANGQVSVNNGEKEVNEATVIQASAYIRCVYDEWFWGDATTRPVQDKNTFTWGDRDY